jgi:hypothetical protein
MRFINKIGLGVREFTTNKDLSMKKNGEDFEFLSGCLLSYDICSELYLF